MQSPKTAFRIASPIVEREGEALAKFDAPGDARTFQAADRMEDSSVPEHKIEGENAVLHGGFHAHAAGIHLPSNPAEEGAARRQCAGEDDGKHRQNHPPPQLSKGADRVGAERRKGSLDAGFHSLGGLPAGRATREMFLDFPAALLAGQPVEAERE